jgi:cytochrome o ubiquinol oxidase subunit 2
MRFAAKSLSAGDFQTWVAKARGRPMLDRATYLTLERPTEGHPVLRFASVDPNLFDAVVNMCVEPGKMCMHQIMMADAMGGVPAERAGDVRAVTYDKDKARGTDTPLSQTAPPTSPFNDNRLDPNAPVDRGSQPQGGGSGHQSHSSH